MERMLNYANSHTTQTPNQTPTLPPTHPSVTAPTFDPNPPLADFSGPPHRAVHRHPLLNDILFYPGQPIDREYEPPVLPAEDNP